MPSSPLPDAVLPLIAQSKIRKPLALLDLAVQFGTVPAVRPKNPSPPLPVAGQACGLVWQLGGQAVNRQVEGARVGITANQGLFGHGSSVLCVK